MTDKDKLKKIKELADDMYYAAANLGPNVGSGERLRKTMEEYHKFIIHEYHKKEADWLQELHNKLDSLSKEDFDKVWAKYHQKEEPVNEDFETALEKKVREAQDWTYIEEEGGECPLNEEFGAYDLEEFARWGAMWQKENMESSRIKHSNSITEEQYNLETGFIDQHLDKYQRMPTFLDAIEYGMKLKEQQMDECLKDMSNEIDLIGD